MKKTFKYILTVVLSAFFGIQMNAQNGAVVLDKNVTDNQDGTYSLTLESYVTGKTVWKPMDIVLVLDNSNSMYSYPTSDNQNRAAALKSAVKNFIDIIYNNGNTANHRIAIIEFEGGGRRIDHYLTIDENNLRAYDAYYAYLNNNNKTTKSWGEMNSTDVSNMKNAVDALKKTYLTPGIRVDGNRKYDTGTPAAEGFVKAYKYLYEDPVIANDGREKMVVFFTDGCCGTGETWGEKKKYYPDDNNLWGYDGTVEAPNRYYAQLVVKKANKLKEKKATIFSIGTFGSYTDDQMKDTYFYMRHVSSQYSSDIKVTGNIPDTPLEGKISSDLNPNINGITGDDLNYVYTKNFHTIDEGDRELYDSNKDKYIFDGSNSTNLKKAFETIATIVKSSAELGGETTVVLDALTNMFKLPAGATVDNINLYTCDVETGASTLTWTTTGTGGETHYKDSDNKDLGTTPVSGARAEYWVPWTPWTSGTNDKDYYIHVNPTNPVASDIASDSDVIEVTGYDFATNCVAMDANKTKYVQGQKLIIQFVIETDPANTGGINLKTNDPASGIYEKTGDNTYEIFLGYEQPEVYLPYIKIIKTGLEQHESAAFRITKVTGLDGATASSDNTEFTATVMLSQDKTDKSAVEAIVKLIYTGFYRVEELDWSWTYTRGEAQVKELSTIKQDTFDETGYLVYEFSNTKNTSTNGNAAEWCVINEMGL